MSWRTRTFGISGSVTRSTAGSCSRPLAPSPRSAPAEDGALPSMAVNTGNKSQTLHLRGCERGLGNSREEEEEYTVLPGYVGGGSSMLGLFLLPVLVPSMFFVQYFCY